MTKSLIERLDESQRSKLATVCKLIVGFVYEVFGTQNKREAINLGNRVVNKEWKPILHKSKELRLRLDSENKVVDDCKLPGYYQSLACHILEQLDLNQAKP